MIVLFVVLAVLFVGDLAGVTHQSHHSGVAVPTTPVAPPTGYQSFVQLTDHFSLAVPDTWGQVDPTSKSFQAQNRQLAKANPGLAFGDDPGDKDIRFLAYAPGSAGSVHAGVEIEREGLPLLADKDLDHLADEFQDEFKHVGITISSTTPTTLSGRPARTMVGTLNFKSPAGAPVAVPLSLTFVVSHGSVYFFNTYGTGPVLDAIKATFRVTRAG